MKIYDIIAASASSSTSYALDVIPGAALAYCMKKLSSTYTGFAFTARRSSDNATTDVSFDNVGVVSNNSSVSVGGTFGTWRGVDTIFIQTLYDQGGSNNDITQATLNRQFVFVDADYKGYPVIRSNNTPTATFLQGTNTVLKNINSYSEYSKLKVDSASAGANTIISGGAALLSGLFTTVSSNIIRFNYRSPYANSGGDNVQSTSGIVNNVYFSYAGIRDGSAGTQKIFKDANLLATNLTLTQPAWPNTNMAMTMSANNGSLASGSLAGDYFALVCYPFALTNAQLNYLNSTL